jgi:putative ABC transport system substrate-binding protein
MKAKFRKQGLLAFVIVVSITITFFFSVQAYSQTNAQEVKKTVGVLISSDFRTPKVEGLKNALKDYGYIEGETVSYIIKNANRDSELLSVFAEQLISEQPDVIFVAGESEALAVQAALKEKASSIPIIFVGVDSAQKFGLVESDASPGKNITGVENYYLLLSGKRLEYFQRLLPEVKNIVVLYDPRVTPTQPTLAFLDEAAQKLNLSLQAVPVKRLEEVLSVLNGLDHQKVDGVMFLCCDLLESITDEVSPIAIEKHIPIMGVSEEQTKRGLLASYGMPYYEQGFQASRLVAKVLRGEEPSQLPVESPEKVEFIVNLETATKLGIILDPAGLTCVTKFVGR